MIQALAILALLPAAAFAGTGFDYRTLAGDYVSFDCHHAPGGSSLDQPAQPLDAWNGTHFRIALDSPDGAGLVVTTLGDNLPEYFGLRFPGIDQGPQHSERSNPDMGMSSSDVSTAVTTPNGVRVVIRSLMSAPVVGKAMFTVLGELQLTSSGLRYKLTEVSPDPAQGEDAKWFQWHGCLLRKAD